MSKLPYVVGKLTNDFGFLLVSDENNQFVLSLYDKHVCLSAGKLNDKIIKSTDDPSWEKLNLFWLFNGPINKKELYAQFPISNDNDWVYYLAGYLKARMS